MTDFFSAQFVHICASILKKNCTSVCQSGYKRQNCKTMENRYSRLLFYSEIWIIFVNVFTRDSVSSISNDVLWNYMIDIAMKNESWKKSKMKRNKSFLF